MNLLSTNNIYFLLFIFLLFLFSTFVIFFLLVDISYLFLLYLNVTGNIEKYFGKIMYKYLYYICYKRFSIIIKS